MGFVLVSSGICAAAEDQAAKEDRFAYKKPMPDIPFLPEDEFLEQTVPYEIKPTEDRTLSYTVRLPKDWEQKDNEGDSMDLMMSKKLLGNISRYVSSANFDSPFPSQFTVQAIGLEYELSAEQWFLQYLLSRGYALQGMKVYDKNRAEALYVNVERDVSYAIRSVAIRNGKRIILGRYKMPLERWPKEKSIQAQIIANFDLTNRQEELVEKMKVHQFLDIARFEYPESWQLRAPPFSSLDRLSVELLSVLDIDKEFRTNKTSIALDGKIDLSLVSVYAGEALEQEAQNFKSRLESTGLIFEEQLEPDKQMKFNPAFEETNLEIFKVLGEESALLDYEFWMSVMSYGDYYYFVTLLTPSREDDFYTWSRNTQTYRLIVERFIPQELARDLQE